MRMVMAVLPKQEAGDVLDELVAQGYTATYWETKGGVLQQTRVAMYVAVEQQELSAVLDIIRGHCHSSVCVEDREGDLPSAPLKSHTAEVGGAVVFVWDLKSFYRF